MIKPFRNLYADNITERLSKVHKRELCTIHRMEGRNTILLPNNSGKARCDRSNTALAAVVEHGCPIEPLRFHWYWRVNGKRGAILQKKRVSEVDLYLLFSTQDACAQPVDDRNIFSAPKLSDW